MSSRTCRTLKQNYKIKQESTELAQSSRDRTDGRLRYKTDDKQEETKAL